MLLDFHHNIFYFYKGSQKDDSERTRQLEDNTTKALINILENIDQEIVVKFLYYIGLSSFKINNIQYCLQRNNIGKSSLRRKKELVLLAIVPEKKNILPISYKNKNYSRPDAWIYNDDFAILLESKVVGCLDYSQMREHYKKLDIKSQSEPKLIEITWSDIYTFFKSEIELLSKTKQTITKFLLGQFTEYLDMANLTEFTGFDSEFFDYFFYHDNEESRKWVKNKINSFVSLIFDEMSSVDKSFYQSFDIGVLSKKKNYSWVAFGPKDKKYRKVTHLSIKFNSQGIEIFINIETKPATDQLKNVILCKSNEFVQAIKKLCINDKLTFIVEKREQKQVSDYDFIKLFQVESFAFLDTDFSDSTYEFFVNSIINTRLPSINIIKKIHRKDAIAMSSGDSPEQLVKELSRIANKFHGFISFCNQKINKSKIYKLENYAISHKSLEEHFENWRRKNNPINNWGLAWYLANEFAKRFYKSHGISPHVCVHEGLGYYGITLDPIDCVINRECTRSTIGRITAHGCIECWASGVPGENRLNTIEMCEQNISIDEIMRESISFLRLPPLPERSHMTCRHKRWGDSFLLLFEIATFLAIKYCSEGDFVHILNHPEHINEYLEQFDPQIKKQQEYIGAFVFTNSDKKIIFAHDGRELTGEAQENYWTRFMQGESSYSLYKDLSAKLGLIL